MKIEQAIDPEIPNWLQNNAERKVIGKAYSFTRTYNIGYIQKEVRMKEKYELRDMMYQFQKEITYYSQMEALAVSQYEKNYNHELIKERTEEIIRVLEKRIEAAEGETTEPPEQRTFTLEELEQYNGKNGNPPYVAIGGTVYDMSSKVVWSGGNHFGMMAGRDLTTNFMSCHQGMIQILQQLPVVGVLVEST